MSVLSLIDELRNKPITLYHGSFFDLTNIAILMDLLNDSDTKPEVADMARKALSGTFVHTNFGHHVQEALDSLVDGRSPLHFDFAEMGYYGDTKKAPFYIHKNILKDKHISEQGGRVLCVQPIEIEGIAYYVQENDYFNVKQPAAYRVTLEFGFSHRRPRDLYDDDKSNSIELLYVNVPTQIFARMCDRAALPIYLFYESSDGDSDCFGDLLPSPICDSEWIISGRNAMIVYDEYSPKIKNAYYRFNDYGYVCHMGKLPKNRDWYGYYNIHFPYIHRRYSNLADRLFYHNVCFTKSTESLRLIMHRLSSPDLSAIRNYRYYCTNTCDTELEQKLNEYAANNPDFVRKMIGELGKIYFPIEEAETTGFSKWLYMNANKYFIEHTNNCTGGDRSKCPHCSNNVYSCKNVSYGSDYCPIAKPPEFVAIILCRHCKEPWVDDYCKCLFHSPYSDYPFPAEYPSTFGNTGANGNPNNLYSALHCISNSDQMEWYYRVLVVAEENLDADYKKPEHQIFLAHSGFGCNPKAIGRAVYGMHLSDGEICRRNCDNFVGIMKDEYIPDWARDKMAEAKEILDKKLGEV